MNVRVTRSHFGAIASITCFLFASTLSVQAQIVPDGTLPNNSVVTPNGSTLTITGGTQVGTNLFHSFEQFSVLTGQTAYFNHALNVQNILARVTGGQISSIDGLIQGNGSANLFLINPSGISFGANAQLNIGGSLIASTANSIKFADGSEFSATNPQAPPLLTINIPIGLQFGSNPGQIINQSRAVAQGNLPTLPPQIPIANNVGLAVNPGQTLALIGGDVLLNGGNLTANTGQIFLGSVKSAGFVGFTPTPFGLSLNYDNIQNFGNIQLSDGALINTTGLGGGKVEIRGGNVSLNGSRIYALTLGNIDGRGIDINAQTFRAEGGTQISTLTRGNGAAGAVNIRATDSVEMIGIGFNLYRVFAGKYLVSGSINPFDPQVLLITGTTGMGNAGNITIDTGKLLFDRLTQKHGLEKIKTIGDAYMVVGGLPTPRADHAEAVVEMALDMQQEITRFQREDGKPFGLRIGINTGSVVAGVIGTKKFAYDLWGDTVNVASRMESQGVAGGIQVTAATYELLKDKYVFEQRDVITVKGKGEMITYWLTGRKGVHPVFVKIRSGLWGSTEVEEFSEQSNSRSIER